MLQRDAPPRRGSRSTTRSTCSPSTASAGCSAPSRPASSRPPPSSRPTRACSRAIPSSSCTSSSRSAPRSPTPSSSTFVIVKVVDLDPRDPGLGTRRGDRPRPRRPRRGRLPDCVTAVGRDSSSVPTDRSRTAPTAAARPSAAAARPLSETPCDRRDRRATRLRSTTPASSTTPAASGSSPTRADGRAAGSCRSRSAGLGRPRPSRRVRAPTASRATAPASRSRSTPSLLDLIAGRTRRPPGRGRAWRSSRGRRRRTVGPPARRRRRPSTPKASRSCGWRSRPVRTPARSAPRRPPRDRSSRRPSSRDRRLARPPAFEFARLVVARRRLEIGAREAAAGPRRALDPVLVVRGRSSTRASSPGRASPSCTRTCARRWTSATRSSTSAMRRTRRPIWRLAQPFRLDRPQRRDQHRPRQPRAGPRAGTRDRGAGAVRAPSCSTPGRCSRPTARTRCPSTRRSSSSTTTGWELAPGAARRDPRGARRSAARRTRTSPTLRRRTAGMLAPWDGPAAIVFADGRRVGALVDRNGLRPAAFAMTRDRLVAVASEAGAVPFDARPRPSGAGGWARARCSSSSPRGAASSRTPMPRRAPSAACRSTTRRGRPTTTRRRRRPRRSSAAARSPHALRYLAGLDAEKARLDIKTMALEGHEPLWSMGDDTPTPGRVARRSTSRRPPAPGVRPGHEPGDRSGARAGRHGPARRARATAVAPRRPAARAADARASTARSSPTSTACSRSCRRAGRRVRVLDATWPAGDGGRGLAAALDRLAADAVDATPARRRASSSSSDASLSTDRLPLPSVLAVGAVHTALTDAGLRGRTDIVADAADVLDVHALGDGPRGRRHGRPSAARARARRPSSRARAAPRRSPRPTRSQNLVDAFEAGLRKTLARMGISAVASVHRRGAHRHRRPRARGHRSAASRRPRRGPGGRRSTTSRDAELRRRDAALALPPTAPGREPRLPDLGFARFRADGEAHLFAPRVVERDPAALGSPRPIARRRPDWTIRSDATARRCADSRRSRRLRVTNSASGRVRAPSRSTRSKARARSPGGSSCPAMSVGALSPEAHQALTIGIQRAGGSANTGEGGEDPAWYATRRRRPAPRCPDQAGRLGAIRCHGDLPGTGRPARDQDRAGLEARRRRSAARRRKATALHRRAAPRPSPVRATSARRRITTSTRSRTSPSSSPTCVRSIRAPGSA